MTTKSIRVHSPGEIPKVEHWAIITGSSVSHEESGVWAPGHGYPAYTEDVVEYEAFLNEADFLEEMQKAINREYPKVIGIHVDKMYTKQMVVKVVEKELSK